MKSSEQRQVFCNFHHVPITSILFCSSSSGFSSCKRDTDRHSWVPSSLPFTSPFRSIWQHMCLWKAIWGIMTNLLFITLSFSLFLQKPIAGQLLFATKRRDRKAHIVSIMGIRIPQSGYFAKVLIPESINDWWPNGVSALIFRDKYLPDPSLLHRENLQSASARWRDGLLCKSFTLGH